MTAMLRSITTKIAVTILLITGFNSAVMADGTDHISGDTSMTGSTVVAGIFAVLAFVVIFSHNKKTQ
jgi:uncharacterized membrane protein